MGVSRMGGEGDRPPSVSSRGNGSMIAPRTSGIGEPFSPGSQARGGWRRWWGRLFIVLVTLLALVYGGVSAQLYFSQSSKVFRPRQGLAATPAEWGVLFQEVHFLSQEHRLHGWWIPGDSERSVILFFHGNASVISGQKGHVELFQRMGLGVFLFDYRGYGLSEGTPSEAGVYADAEAAWSHLTGVLGMPEKRVILYGHSLGGGVATWLAARHAPQAMMLEGTFLSIPAVGEELYPYLPIRLLSRIWFDNASRIGQIRVPLLILHSRDDTVIFPRHGRELFALANDPKTFLETSGSHNTSVSQGGLAVEEGMRRFVADLQKPR
ncbi:MAG: alpha/beta fold hydrolase [Magnetococcales bacterium]|nr:alpha/beta fold hydrolase [Magnetococcales bacterium]